LQNVIVLLYSTTEFDINEGTIVTLATGATTSGEQVELGTVVIGDLPFLRSIGRIQRYVALGQWENTSLKWGHGVPELLSLTHLVTREILSLRRKNTKIIAYVIRSQYAGAANKILGNVVTRASYLANSGIWDIETFVPVIDRAGIAWSDYVETDQIGGAPGGITLPPPPAGTFIGLNDTPVSYAGQAGKVPQVNSGETGLEWGSGGGGLWKRTGIVLSPTTADDTINVQSSENSSTVAYFRATGSSMAVMAQSTTSNAIYAISSLSTAILAAASVGNAFLGTAGSGNGIGVSSETGIAGIFSINPSTINDLKQVINLIRRTSGTAQSGMGGYIGCDLENPALSQVQVARLCYLWANATDGSETSDFAIQLRNAGAALAEVMRLTGAGVLDVKSGFSVDSTPAVADGTYTVGIGSTQNGTITTKGGIIIAIQEAI
jgi:hypothetical protein